MVFIKRYIQVTLACLPLSIDIKKNIIIALTVKNFKDMTAP